MLFILAVYTCRCSTRLYISPLLFLLYINDIVDNIQSQVRLFADDTSIFLIVDNAIESADILDRDLNTITSWSNKWLVSFSFLDGYLAESQQTTSSISSYE